MVTESQLKLVFIILALEESWYEVGLAQAVAGEHRNAPSAVIVRRDVQRVEAESTIIWVVSQFFLLVRG